MPNVRRRPSLDRPSGLISLHTPLAILPEARACWWKAALEATRTPPSPDALASAYAQWLDGALATTIQDGIAVIPVRGPLMKSWSWLSWLFGASTYDEISYDLEVALATPAVRAIVLDVDSPGGEVAGVDELAAKIRAGTDQVPIVAMASGTIASAAYWLGSAASTIRITPTTMAGSIGVITTMYDDTEWLKMLGIERVEIVSTQSPKKRMDPTEPEGRADIQRIVDALAAGFIRDVARYRAIDEDQVIADFGGGSVLVGQGAVDAGLADAIDTMDALRGRLREETSRASLTTFATLTMTTTAKRFATGAGPAQGQATPPVPTAKADEEKNDDLEEEASSDSDMHDDEDMPPKEKQDDEDSEASAAALAARHPQAVAEIRDAATQAERERLLAIDALARPGLESLIASCKADAACTPGDAALRILAAQKDKGKQYLGARAADEEKVDAPRNDDTTDDGAEAMVRSILSAHRKATSPQRASAGRA